MMVDYVRVMTVKKSRKNGEYESFEYLLFMFKVCFLFCSLKLLQPLALAFVIGMIVNSYAF